MRLGDVRGRALRGTWYHAPEPDRIEVLADAVVVIDPTGTIEAVLRPGQGGYEAAANRAMDVSGLLLPGFVDLHIHAPQYPQLGQALDEPLEVWLQKYTFPLEARYADPEFARPRYDALIRDLLANGTTTACYFGTVDLAATEMLADYAVHHGQRALVGKVVMDDPATCPGDYRDASAAQAILETRALINHIRDHPGNGESRVLPIVTPRFIPSCTDEALAGLGALAKEMDVHVQTHCSESDWAHAHALGRYGETDTAVLAGFGLLGRRTVLAHSNFITEGDMTMIRDRGGAVAHCPVSNAYFANAVFPLRRALEKGLHVGLGTDISGGPISSVFDAARGAVMVSRMLETGVDPGLPQAERGVPGSAISIATAFHLATAGGGVALDLPIGRFEAGYCFEAFAVDPEAPGGTVRLFAGAEPIAALETTLYTASRANIAEVWVDGRSVAGSTFDREQTAGAAA